MFAVHTGWASSTAKIAKARKLLGMLIAICSCKRTRKSVRTKRASAVDCVK